MMCTNAGRNTRAGNMPDARRHTSTKSGRIKTKHHTMKTSIKCDTKGCEAPATRNYQTGRVSWDIDDFGYSFDEMYPDNVENVHTCDEHDNG